MIKILVILLCIFLLGCQSTMPYQKQGEGASGKSETPQDVRRAIESVAGAVSQSPIRVKYCPVCGRRFSPSIVQCPFDGAQLKELE